MTNENQSKKEAAYVISPEGYAQDQISRSAFYLAGHQEMEDIGAARTFGVGERLSVLDGDYLGKVISVNHHEIVELSEQVRADLEEGRGKLSRSASPLLAGQDTISQEIQQHLFYLVQLSR